MKNEYLYAVIGLLVGVLVTGGFYGSQNTMPAMNHQMSDGTMMDGNISMEHQMSTMSESLRGKTGDEFDKEFLSQMIVHHVGAVEMARQALAASKRPELLKLANDIISAQEKEITQMREWQRTWFQR